jgi:uncharacterized phiE125 gp8 family phage protein
LYASDCLPISKPVRTAEPTLLQEPVTVAEARRQCGIGEGIDYHDPQLQLLITAAREQVENDTGIVCYTGSFTYKMTEWPYGDFFTLADLRPVTSITSIAYLDTDGASQTLATTVYQLETANVKQFVRLKYNQLWPSLRGDINGITVTFVAGYATVLAVPSRVKQAVLFLVNHWFVSRDTVSIGTISPEISLTYDALINGLGRRTYP